MTNTKHTPGPWVWDSHYDDLRPLWYSEMSQGCGYLSWDNDETRDANAHLIAAAPDLLEALEAIVATWDGPKYNHFMADNIDLARAAIAKAKGQTE